MPGALIKKYTEQFGLSGYDAAQITADKNDAEFYNAVIETGANHKSAANWLIGPVRKYCSDKIFPWVNFR